MDFVDGDACKLIQKSLNYQKKAYNNESDSDGNDIDDDDIVTNVQYTISQINVEKLVEQILAAIKTESNYGSEQYYRALVYLKYILGKVTILIAKFLHSVVFDIKALCIFKITENIKSILK